MSMKFLSPQISILYSKIGVCRGIPIFLIFAQNIDCGYTLELNFKQILLKIFSFYNFKNLCILHEHVFVMQYKWDLLGYHSKFCLTFYFFVKNIDCGYSF